MITCMACANKVVEVFKTNVTSTTVAQQIALCLMSSMEGSRATFDLQDVDRILRIASTQKIQAEIVVAIVKTFGFHASPLPDHIEDVVPETMKGSPMSRIKSKIENQKS